MAQKVVRVTSGQRKIISNVRSFFEKERELQRSIKRDQVVARTSLATRVSESTVKRVSKEYRVEGEFKSPEKRYVKDRLRLYPDDFNRDAIRRIIHDSYLNKDYPTLDSVLRKAGSTGVFDGGRMTRNKLLKSMGFRYKKREDGKKYIYEQPRVIEQRHQYLRRMRRNREERRPEVFLDETWTNSHAAPEKLWVD